MSTNITPEISVVMSVYNGEIFLKEAIESILSQSFTNFEFIIINDGSKDATERVIQEYAQQDNRIKIISRENRGLVASLNEGVNIARSELIARMDADDIALPDRLNIQYKFMRDNHNVVCVGADPIIIDEDGEELTRLTTPSDNNKIQQQLLSGHCPLEHPSVMFRRSVALSVGGYRKAFETAEDYDLWLRMGELGELANIQLPLLKYRYLNTSISAKNQKQQALMTRKACEEAWKRRGVNSTFTATNEWRQTDSKDSKYKFAMKFGWWAFSYPNKVAAIKYAKCAIKLIPWRKNAWILLIYSYLKLN